MVRDGRYWLMKIKVQNLFIYEVCDLYFPNAGTRQAIVWGHARCVLYDTDIVWNYSCFFAPSLNGVLAGFCDVFSRSSRCSKMCQASRYLRSTFPTITRSFHRQCFGKCSQEGCSHSKESTQKVQLQWKFIGHAKLPFFVSLSAMGWGWGGRMKFSVMHGCIPVIVQVWQIGIEILFLKPNWH